MKYINKTIPKCLLKNVILFFIARIIMQIYNMKFHMENECDAAFSYAPPRKHTINSMLKYSNLVYD